MSNGNVLSGVLQALFWLALAVIAYTYAGYPLLIGLLARLWPRPVRRGDEIPSVTVLIPAYNEAGCIAAKLANTLALDYPAGRCEILVVADGSTDRTAEIASAYAGRDLGRPVHVLSRAERQGKIGAIIRALPEIDSDVILFTDANCALPGDVLRRMAPYFADDEVGAVSGSKRIARGNETPQGSGENLYWRYESYLKGREATTSSVMGVPGEVWAVRRAVYVPPEPDSLLDDYLASLRLVERGWRVAYEPAAVATEPASPGLGAEWERRARNAAGGWQAFFRLPGMLRHPRPLITFQYLSHRVLRWMVTPALFVALLLANMGLVLHPATDGSSLYRLALVAQGAFYALAGLGWALASGNRRLPGWLLAPFYVVMLNAAALAGAWRYLRGSQPVAWSKVR